MYSALADGFELSGPQLEELDDRERAASQLADRLATLRPQPGFDSPMGFQQVKDELSNDDIVLSYLMVNDRLTLQVITNDQVWSRSDLAGKTEIAGLVAGLQFQVGRALAHGSSNSSAARTARLQRDADAALTRLYNVLIAPIEQWMPFRGRLVVVPSGDLHGVPFSALLHDGAYLVDRFEIITAPGLGILAGLSELSRTDQFQRPLVCGVPDDLAPGLGDEARFVGQRFQDVTLLLGESATRDTVLRAIAGSDLVHLACHGRFDSVHPSASGIRLADGWLTLDRLIEVRLEQSLVLLTGCETGRVRVDEGDDLVGIVAAMVAAGAAGVVSSLWKTHDDAATALIGSFYDALERGEDLAGALHASQVAVRELFAHPAYWAPFVGLQTITKRTAQ